MKKNYTIFKHFLLLLLLLLTSNFTCQEINYSGWKELDNILSNIKPPSFQSKDFNVLNYGAVADGKTLCTQAFKNAIEACSKSGGGRVVVPEGEFLTGAIHLKNNVNLYLAKKAIVKFSTDPKDYLPVVFTRWEGVECMNYSPLIYAYEQENIAVTGEGILDGCGQSENWWSWKGKKEYGWVKGMPGQKEARDKLFEMGEKNVSVEKRIFGEGSYLRPSFFQPYKCKNILVEGVTFKDSPMWFLNPVLCSNVTIKNVTVEGLGPNNDGCDPECCKDVLIDNCFFNNGDDCIAIKSGRNNDGRRINIPSENIIIRNCTMKEGHGGVVIGSEISGGVKNVFVDNCKMDSPNLDRAIRLKTNSIRGGVIENLFVKDVTVGQVKEAAIHINYFYEEGDKGEFTPVIRNIFVENMKCEKSSYAIWIKAYDRSPVQNLFLKDCSFNGVENENVMESVKNIRFTNVKINNKEITVD